MVTARPYDWMVSRWRRYGDVFSSHFPIFGRVVYVADPAEIKRVFAGDAATFHAGEANFLALGDALGDHSLLTLDEGRHMSQRKLLLPPFHGESVRRYAEVMAEATAREVDGWPVGRELALRPRMQAITLEVILRAVFGVRDGERMDLLRERIPRLADTTSVLTWLPFMDRDLGGLSPCRPLPPGARRGGRADLRRDRRAARVRARRGRALAAALGPPRGRQPDVRRRAARRAHDAAHRGPRDHRHRALLGVRAPDAHAARDGHGCSTRSTTTSTSTPW